MDNFLYRIYDFFVNILEKLSVVLIAVVLGFVIFTRLDSLFQSELVSIEPITVDQEEDLLVQKDGAAPIVFKGELSDKEEKINNVTEIVNERNREIETISFEITDDDNVDTILDKFVELGFIEDRATFKSMLNDLGLIDYIQPGNYEVDKNIKNLDLAETITIAEEE